MLHYYNYIFNIVNIENETSENKDLIQLKVLITIQTEFKTYTFLLTILKQNN